jgi:hypothetical protein
MTRRLLKILLLLAVAGWAANVKLYLKDGGYHVVREYKVEGDRVRYYSVERSQWEEIPLELVDLARSQREAAARQEAQEKDAQAVAAEENAERQMLREARRIPQDPGVYVLEGNAVKPIPVAKSVVHTNKGRSILKALSPLPMVPGKATLEVDGARSANVFTNREQEFFIQLSEPERFAIFRLTPKGNVRIVEKITIMPVTNEMVEEPLEVEIFRKELDVGSLYRIWPKEKLAMGEYAVVQYTAGKLNIQIWDFAIR